MLLVLQWELGDAWDFVEFFTIHSCLIRKLRKYFGDQVYGKMDEGLQNFDEPVINLCLDLVCFVHLGNPNFTIRLYKK